ncbi:MAG: alpha-N-arabinofuranosidase [Prevotella sp.]|nr:alpha-N-arabinofuranosidase [Prevotella sp.]
MRPRHYLFVVAVALWSTGLMAQNQVFIYSPHPSAGLHIAALQKDSTWQDLGQLCSSDYGTWGTEKKMHHPSVCRADDGSWRLVFQVNERSPLFAAAYSRDLVTWRPQDYPRVSTHNCLSPVVHPVTGGYEIIYRSDDNFYQVSASPDFRHFSDSKQMGQVPSALLGVLQGEVKVNIGDKEMAGQTFELTNEELERIRRHFETMSEDGRKSGERMHDDVRNLNLPKTIEATLTVDAGNSKAISNQLIGIFFEDISYAADGGLYAELVQNRDFEYNAKDRREWTATTAWHSPAEIRIADSQPLSLQNPHHALVTCDSLWNEGWDGIAVEMGKKYDFSIFVRGKKTIVIQLMAADGTVIAQGQVKAKDKDWKRYETTLTALKTDDKTRLLLLPQGNKEAAIDMVSLFPQETFKNRRNGLRKDLAETIAALKPKFVRFPGGCMSHGQGLDNIYHWQHTIGPLQNRTPDSNIWHYHQTRGLGFYEYFVFCEDIGAEPLPVLAAGVPCQNSANNHEGVGGQQGGIPMDQMPAYIDELCHLIDWANGDPATNEWARKRALAGHPEPFHLKYIGIGNEDIISTTFEERYEMICRAIRERHPDIKICGTVGPFHTPSADYIEGWDFTKKHPDLQYMTDEHYYESTGWFMHHRNYYDNYDRQAAKVYLGEWAASTKAKRPNVETALAEALYLTDIERNGDIVEMSSYAPMLCKDGHSNWNPDMIYFSNTTIRTTPAYEVQRLFSVYSGDRYVNSQLSILHSTLPPDSSKNYQLSYRIGASVVKDTKTGKTYLKLVNALPSTLKIDVEGLRIPAKVKCEQFCGNGVEDQKAKAEMIETSEPTTLPPYSMRVIKL